MTTFNTARGILRELGVTIRPRDSAGEYRVNFCNGGEATAYYTSDLDDAVGTGVAMVAHLAAVEEERKRREALDAGPLAARRYHVDRLIRQGQEPVVEKPAEPPSGCGYLRCYEARHRKSWRHRHAWASTL